ncbi:hypothetical protein D5125_07900 [Magnetovirga frankeli]|uniref:hypothetical protein n=1 Tax=Magnetovirga frankeli TaxID=947516 RepID=UPI001292E29A|nr:hypothetical protein D5125_07900 [gamma proteobacterium SS-5]
MANLVLAQALLRQRADYNQRFAQARHLHRHLQADAFFAVLRQYAAPLLEPLAEADDSALDRLVSPLYDLCLQLTAQELLGPGTPAGARLPALALLFERLLPALTPLLLAQPRPLLAALGNAVYNLAQEPGADPTCWIERLTALAPRLRDLDSLLRVGQLAAWRCGLAHYREGALQAASALPPGLVGALMERPELADAALLAKLADPWYRPDQPEGDAKTLRLLGRIGGFIGFDGPFADPPELMRFDQAIYALDSRQAWRLYADAYGQTLKPVGNDLPEGEPDSWTHFGLERDGRVSRGPHRAQFSQLAGWSSAASTEHCLVVSLPHSHYLFLVALC